MVKEPKLSDMYDTYKRSVAEEKARREYESKERHVEDLYTQARCLGSEADRLRFRDWQESDRLRAEAGELASRASYMRQRMSDEIFKNAFRDYTLDWCFAE